MALRIQHPKCYKVLKADVDTSYAKFDSLQYHFAGLYSKEGMGLTKPASVIGVTCDFHTEHVKFGIIPAAIMLL